MSVSPHQHGPPRQRRSSGPELRDPRELLEPRPPKKRTPLSAPSLGFAREGDPEAAEQLRRALSVPPLPEKVEAEDRPLFESTLMTHLFHSFAGRTHPLLVRHLLADRKLPAGAVVLDPFVGSGTVLVEATLAGLRGVGCDVNPLAVRLGRFKATPLPPTMQKALVARAEAVFDLSMERVKTKQRPTKTWDSAEHFPPHVFLELCGLRQEIAHVVEEDPPLGEALLLIFSSLVIKASQQRAETDASRVDRHIGRGQVTRWFLAKAEEVARLHDAMWERLPPNAATLPPPLVLDGDARTLFTAKNLPLMTGSVDCIITSPPYLGTYDYAGHHARRFAWLDIDPQPMLRGEMAARRHGAVAPLPKLVARHQRDTHAWMYAIGRLLKPGGRLYVLVGDSVVMGQAVRGDTPIRNAAEKSSLRFVARVAAERPSYHRADVKTPRLEHLLEFARPDA